MTDDDERSSPPEVIEVQECDPPTRIPKTGRQRQTIDTSVVRAWLLEHPGEWCRLIGAGDRVFSHSEVAALRGGLGSTLFIPGWGTRSVSVQTRPHREGFHVYARSETDEEHRRRYPFTIPRSHSASG